MNDRFTEAAVAFAGDGVIVAINTGEHLESWNLPDGRSVTGQTIVAVGTPPTVAASTITVPHRSGVILRLKNAR